MAEEELAIENDVAFDGKLYPNPCKGLFKIVFENEVNLSGSSLSIYDMTGRLVQVRDLSGIDVSTVEFDLSNEHEGLYFLVISRNGNLLQSYRVMKVN